MTMALGTTSGWQTGSVRIELNGPGIRELLLSDEVAADIERRADTVAAQANSRYESIRVGGRDAGAHAGEEGEHIKARVDMGKGKNRARARVVADHPAARNVEARDRVLGHSIDAANS